MKITVNANIVRVTPEMASEWLADRWGEQRPIRVNHKNRLISDMMAGRFHISPDAILRIKGKLANGQHRLEALVECGKPQTFLVMESNDDDLYKVIDAGLKRTVSDGLLGFSYATSIPSVARWVWAYERQSVLASSRVASEAQAADSPNRVFPTQIEMIDYCQDRQQEFCEAVSFVKPIYDKSHTLPLSIGGAIYVIGSKKNLDKTVEFLDRVYNGGGNDSSHDLHARLVANRGSKARLSQGYIFGITIKALKSFMQGTRPGVLKWVKGEEFPQL